MVMKMNDLISRQDAIMAVKTGALSAATIYGRTDEGSTALYETVRAIKALPSAQPECKQECMPMYADVSDTISRRAALEAMDTWDKFGCDPDGKLVRYDDDKHYVLYVHYEDMVHAIKHLPSAQPEPAIPLSWIEGQIEWLKSLDNAFSTLTAGQILAMMNKWKDEQDG